ncbi:hypothetical protein RZS08_22375, partial [Arthrospira platensis SPKY1]|nr:hypothetical protein [Arthrospira platensis SPKY1]
DDELRAILEQSGYTFDEVVVTATHLNPMEEIWKMHDGFEFDREYDGYDAENNRAANGGDDVNPASAYWHYKFGEKADYHVDISQVNWSMLSAKDFPDGVGSIRQINIFNIKPFSTAGIVFGDIRLQYLGNNQIKDADVFGSGPLAGKPYF